MSKRAQVLSQASGPRYAVSENARFYVHVWRARDDVHVWRARDDVHAWRARHPMHVMTFLWWRTSDNMSVLTWCGHSLWEPLFQSTHKTLFLYFFLFLFFFNCIGCFLKRFSINVKKKCKKKVKMAEQEDKNLVQVQEVCSVYFLHKNDFWIMMFLADMAF